MRGYLTESAPEFKQAMTELGALRAQLSKASKDAPTSNGDSDYVSRFREYKYQETLFELFTKQYEMAKLDEGREGAVIQVIDTALAPERKSKPKKGLIAILATLGSGFALLMFVFVRQSFRNAAKNAGTQAQLASIAAALKGRRFEG